MWKECTNVINKLHKRLIQTTPYTVVSCQSSRKVEIPQYSGYKQSGSVSLPFINLAFNDNTNLEIEDWSTFSNYIHSELRVNSNPTIVVSRLFGTLPIKIRYGTNHVLYCNVASYSLMCCWLVGVVLLVLT